MRPAEVLPEVLLDPLQAPWRIEPLRASGLAVWIWILAVGALLPILGIPAAGLLAVCAVVLLLRRAQLPWDQRIATAGLVISLLAFAVLGLGLAQLMRPRSGMVAAPQPLRPAAVSGLATVTQWAVLVISIMLHECAHAVAALWSGDGTAARRGRISLNPLTHVDLFGSVILPAVLALTQCGAVFGWAKPVPVDRTQFRHPRWGLLAVTLAGVSINFLLAAACAAGLLAVGSLLRLLYPAATSTGFAAILQPVSFHGVPGGAVWELATLALKQGILINLVLFSFNALPLPPLDGYGVLEALAPASWRRLVLALRPLGGILLLLLIFQQRVIYLLWPVLVLAIGLNWAVAQFTGWN